MKYYIIINQNELQVIHVSSQQEIAFIARYGGQIIVCGDNITDVLVKFNELPLAITEFISL